MTKTTVAGELVLDPISGKPIVDKATGRPYITGPDGSPVVAPVVVPSVEDRLDRLEDALICLMAYACDGSFDRFSRSLKVPVVGQRLEAFFVVIQAERALREAAFGG